MKWIVISILLSTALLLPSLAAPPSSTAEIIDGVIAVVNGEPITFYELEKGEQLFRSQYPASAFSEMDEAEIQANVLRQTINSRLIGQEAKAQGMEATDEEIDVAINEILDRNGITRETLKASLEEEGVVFDEYRGQIAEELTKSKIIQMKVRSKIDLSEDKLREYYLNNQDRFKMEKGVRLRHIIIPVAQEAPPAEIEKAKAKIDEAHEALTAGEPFEQAAMKYSEGHTARGGGELGFFAEGKLHPVFEKAIAGLEPGQFSDVIRTPSSFQILQFVERTEDEVRRFEKVKDDIRRALFEQESERGFNQWIKELYRDAAIEVLQ